MGGAESSHQDEVKSQPSNEKHTKPTFQNSYQDHSNLDATSEKRPVTKLVSEVKHPHKCETILKDADLPVDKSSPEKLYQQLYTGVFLNQKRKKYWVQKKSHANCFMLYARDLLITWSEDNRFWHWPSHNESNDVFVDVAELRNVCWLEIHGKFEASVLSPGILYEFVFEVMLRDPAYGWEVPVNIRLTLPDGSKQEHKENLVEKPRGKWIEIVAGEFMASQDKFGEIEVSLYEYQGGVWKKGLVIKGVAIRPKAHVNV